MRGALDVLLSTVREIGRCSRSPRRAEPVLDERVGQCVRPVREEPERSIILVRKDERREGSLILRPKLREKHHQSVKFIRPRYRDKLKHPELLKKGCCLVV